MHRRALITLPALAVPIMAGAAAAPVVVELFTSQSCSSCPPADDVLAGLVRDRPDVLALSFHVTYWDRLGWRDPFSLPEATQRQRRYAATLPRGAMGAGQIYTPQMVVQGRRDVIGSNRAAVLAAIQAEAARLTAGPAVSVTIHGEHAIVQVGAGVGEGAVWLFGHDARHVTPVRGGENGGRRLAQVQVVRSVVLAGRWQGAALPLQVARPAGERLAVLLQGTDGSIIAAGLG